MHALYLNRNIRFLLRSVSLASSKPKQPNKWAGVGGKGGRLFVQNISTLLEVQTYRYVWFRRWHIKQKKSTRTFFMRVY